jgi:hypothetical protein
MTSRRRIALPLGGFGIEAVEYQAAALGLSPDGFVALAARRHVRSRGERRSLSFLGEPSAESTCVLTVQLEPASWAELEAEASGTGLATSQLLAMASLELAADLDSGRVPALLAADAASAQAA